MTALVIDWSFSPAPRAPYQSILPRFNLTRLDGTRKDKEICFSLSIEIFAYGNCELGIGTWELGVGKPELRVTTRSQVGSLR